jgi:hypothetical protein
MGWIADVDFAPTGAVLAATGTHTIAKVWNMNPVRAIVDDPVREACTMLGGGFDTAEWKVWVPAGIGFRPTC